MPIIGDTVSPSRIAGAAEIRKPATGTKSSTPASTASSKAAGTFMAVRAIQVNTAASVEVIRFPCT